MAVEQQHPIAQTELNVVHDGATYIFKIPGVRDEAKIGSYARFLRVQDDPNGVGAAEGLDFNSFFTYQALATFAVLLRKASVTWPFSPDKTGKPVVDVNQFPDDAPVLEVYEGYLDALARFLGELPEDGRPGGSEVVDGQPESQSEPVQ